MVGGFANCPDCGRATPIEGLRDPIWRLWQVLALAGVAGVTYLVYSSAGIGAASVTGLSLIGLTWLISRAF